jgi:DNA-binding CsgD family transcriptional regulator
MEPLKELSRREQDVVDQLLDGKSNKQIASALHISERTVEFHLKNIYDKHQVASRVELVLKLGSSTVAGKAEAAEDRDSPGSRSWATRLSEAVSKIGKESSMTSIVNSKAGGAGGTLTFFEAIRVCLGKYAEFEGRATRPEFWWFALFVTLAGSALMYLNESVASVFLVAMMLPLLAAGARRLHDSGRSGWWQLFLLAPVGGIVVLGFLWALPPTGPIEESNSAP